MTRPRIPRGVKRPRRSRKCSPAPFLRPLHRGREREQQRIADLEAARACKEARGDRTVKKKAFDDAKKTQDEETRADAKATVPLGVTLRAPPVDHAPRQRARQGASGTARDRRAARARRDPPATPPEPKPPAAVASQPQPKPKPAVPVDPNAPMASNAQTSMLSAVNPFTAAQASERPAGSPVRRRPSRPGPPPAAHRPAEPRPTSAAASSFRTAPGRPRRCSRCRDRPPLRAPSSPSRARAGSPPR